MSYLAKKGFNPSNMANVRQVWEAEQREDLKTKQFNERLKRLKEERQIEDLKRIQVEQGIIPASSLNQIEWMYQDRSAFNKSEQTAEDYLLGKKEVTEKTLTEDKAEGKSGKTHNLASGQLQSAAD